jgi:hypothetical protein
MFERIKYLIPAYRVDAKMQKIVRGRVFGQNTAKDWVEEFVLLAKIKSDGIIYQNEYQWLSPAGRLLLPKKVIIIK